MTISSVRSCQYVFARQKNTKYSKRFKTYSEFYKLITDGRKCQVEAIYKEIRYLKTASVRSCQYVSSCQNLSKYSKRFKNNNNFHKLITYEEMDGHGDKRTLFVSPPFEWHAGLGSAVGCASDWKLGGRGFDPRWGRKHSSVEIDHEIFSTVILSLPLIQEGQLSVSGERMCTILVNRSED